MTSPSHPAPPVPADADVRHLPYLKVDVTRLLRSETWRAATPAERGVAMTLWLNSWQEVPAGSLPNDDRRLAYLAMVDLREWKRVREAAMRGWYEASDGRLYHPVIAEKVAEAIAKSDAARGARQRRSTSRGGNGGPDHGGGSEARSPSSRGGLDDGSPSSRRSLDVAPTSARAVPADVSPNGKAGKPEENQRSAATNVRAPALSRHANCSTREREKERERERESPPPPLPPSPPPARAGPAGRGGAREDDFERIERRCREALGERAPVDLVVGPMVDLVKGGLDLETVLIPLLVEVADGSKKPIRRWSLYADLVRQREAATRGKRVTMPPSGQPPGAATWDERVWRVGLEDARRDGIWHRGVLGPRIGEEGCIVPAHLVEAADTVRRWRDP